MTTPRPDVRRPPIGSYTPDGSAPGAAGGSRAAPTPRRRRLLRWQGAVPLAILLALLAGGFVVFGDRIIEAAAEEALGKALSAHVEIDGLRLDVRRMRVAVTGVAVADPFDPTRNLVQTGRLRAELESGPLLEKKLVIRRLSVADVALGRPRASAAPPAPRDGFAARTVAELRRWRARLEVPPLRLTPIDTVRSLLLDPAQLATVKEAAALRGRAHSVRESLGAGWRGLRLEAAVDSARAAAGRAAAADLRSLDLDGVRRLTDDARRAAGELEAAGRRLEALRVATRGGLDALRDGVASLDEARQRDYAFARGLLALPSFEGPALGNALLGPVTLDQMQRVMYWAEAAQRYMPPGLRPRETPGPERRRAAGTTVRFARARAYPAFHLVRGDLALTLDDGTAAGRYSAAIVDLTSDPAIVARPTRFALRRAGGGDVGAARVSGWLDHTGGVPRDSIGGAAGAARLPAFDIPGLPYRADLGRGAVALELVRYGDRIDARWAVRSQQLSWRADSARVRSLGRLETLAGRALTGLREVEIDGRLTGDARSPELDVRSNLDRALAAQLRGVAGEELRRAEAAARARVDSMVAGHADAARTRAEEVRAEADRRLADGVARLEAERRALHARIAELTRGAITLPALPGTKLPAKVPTPRVPRIPGVP